MRIVLYFWNVTESHEFALVEALSRTLSKMVLHSFVAKVRNKIVRTQVFYSFITFRSHTLVLQWFCLERQFITALVPSLRYQKKLNNFYFFIFFDHLDVVGCWKLQFTFSWFKVITRLYWGLRYEVNDDYALFANKTLHEIFFFIILRSQYYFQFSPYLRCMHIWFLVHVWFLTYFRSKRILL